MIPNHKKLSHRSLASALDPEIHKAFPSLTRAHCSSNAIHLTLARVMHEQSKPIYPNSFSFPPLPPPKIRTCSSYDTTHLLLRAPSAVALSNHSNTNLHLSITPSPSFPLQKLSSLFPSIPYQTSPCTISLQVSIRRRKKQFTSLPKSIHLPVHPSPINILLSPHRYLPIILSMSSFPPNSSIHLILFPHPSTLTSTHHISILPLPPQFPKFLLCPHYSPLTP